MVGQYFRKAWAMNDRIKLPDQEWLGYDPEKGDIHGYTVEQMREFAKLIVLGCCDFIEREGDNMVPGFLMRLTVSTEVILIKEHFGVEE